MNTKKQTIKYFLRFGSFVIAFILIMFALSFYLYPSSNKDLWKNDGGGIFGEPSNSLDYIIIGDSNAVSGFSPLEMWNDYGMTGYVIGENAQTVCGTYYKMKKIFNVQSPKVVVIESDCFFPVGKTKAEKYKMLCGEMFNETFPVFKYHNNWLTLSFDNVFRFKKNYTWKCWSKGQRINTDIEAYTGDNDYMKINTGPKEFDFITKLYFNRLVSLCNKNDTEIVIVSLPCATDQSNDRHNSIQSVADKNNIKFIDYNTGYENLGIDWKTDTRDGGLHLNCTGAKKATNQLGDFIKNRYNISSHKNDDSYDSWNNDYSEYIEKIK